MKKRKIDQLDHAETEQSTSVDYCPICRDNLQEKNLTITKCGHKFCHTCLDSHSSNDQKCPLCRTNMETKIKKINFNDLDVKYSVFKALVYAKHHLHNLNLRLTKKFFDSISDNCLNYYQKHSDNNEINDLKNKICNTLKNDEHFKKNISEFFDEEILKFTIVNSFNTCFYLKSISDSR